MNLDARIVQTRSIWWYTRECFTYHLLNRALGTLDADTIISMGVFIRDLHNQLEQLHQQQVDNYHGESFTLYRGQGLTTNDFEKLLKTKGGLMSFNNFLSTSKNREVSLPFAKSSSEKKDKIGVLFEMTIDPSVLSTPFAAIDAVSYFKAEQEVLFSMHSVFRIGEIQKMDNNSQLYHVQLKLTADDDPQLRILTEHIRQETSGNTGWERLGSLLLKIDQFNKAEELYIILLEQTSDEDKRAFYYNQLGLVYDSMGEYEKALSSHERSLEIRKIALPPNHSDLATSYNNIGLVYNNMGEYEKALSSHERTLEIRKIALPLNHPELAVSYNNIGLVYGSMGEYTKALSSCERALEIYKIVLPPNHPYLAVSYYNIGSVYYNMGEYEKALSSFERALEIRKIALPPNHSRLAMSYNNIGLGHGQFGMIQRESYFPDFKCSLVR